MLKTPAVMICLGLMAGGPALAQSPPPGSEPPDPAPVEPASREHAVVGGKNIQPRTVPREAGQSPEAQLHLLQKGRQDLPPGEPVVVPRDIFGNPLGGNPGLNPPGLEPPPNTAQQVPVPPRF
jgi:hypothetical protein